MKYVCEDCGYTFNRKIKGLPWYATIWCKCPKCKGRANKEGEKLGGMTLSIHRFKDPVAFGHDKKTGQPVAIDKKGKRFDPKETRYDLERDPHGWKAVGKKPRKVDKYGRPIYK